MLFCGVVCIFQVIKNCIFIVIFELLLVAFVLFGVVDLPFDGLTLFVVIVVVVRMMVVMMVVVVAVVLLMLLVIMILMVLCWLSWCI